MDHWDIRLSGKERNRKFKFLFTALLKEAVVDDCVWMATRKLKPMEMMFFWLESTDIRNTSSCRVVAVCRHLTAMGLEWDFTGSSELRKVSMDDDSVKTDHFQQHRFLKARNVYFTLSYHILHQFPFLFPSLLPLLLLLIEISDVWNTHFYSLWHHFLDFRLFLVCAKNSLMSKGGKFALAAVFNGF